MLVFRYNLLSVLLFVVILNCETASSFGGGYAGANTQVSFLPTESIEYLKTYESEPKHQMN